MNTSFLKFILVLISTAVTSMNAWGADKILSCGDLTQIEMNACVKEKFDRVDGELNRLYKEKMASLETKESKDRFRDAQRAWISFRDKACSYEADQFSDGSIWPSKHFDCMESYTIRRIEDLKRYIACVANDCPN